MIHDMNFNLSSTLVHPNNFALRDRPVSSFNRTGLLQSAVFVFLALQPSDGDCIVTVAGPPNIEGAPATSISLNAPMTAVTDGAGGFYVTDYSNMLIRHIYSNATAFTAVGLRGVPGSGGDNGPGTLASTYFPYGLVP